MERDVVIHAHFYQPPREHAWLETIEIQDSAHPYHDWNERVSAECYAPNAFSRILGAEGLINWILNNYRKISFDFGPTLLSWMKQKAPDVHQAIVEADRLSVRERAGHGNAMAQCYNHLIMPLAPDRDKETQVIWGIEDFRSRFGRDPEGMWLPETAADTESLEALAAHGIKFTVLAPGQAHRVRPVSGGDWTHVDAESLETRRPYLVRLPSGREIAVFFYNGAISKAVAFEGLLKSGDALAARLMGGFSKDAGAPELVHIATDGESYGHHSKFGDMALSYCVYKIENEKQANVTNYGQYLEKHPPAWEAQIKQRTSWSCFHGVERWRSDCGCNTGGHPGWDQKWRAPLRESLDWLNEKLSLDFERIGGSYFKNPREARDRYISVVLNREPANVEKFFNEVRKKESFSPADKVSALKLLELARHSMLMFTSCGWFFDELSGIETVQVIQYAGRAIQLHRQLSGSDLEEEFLNRLSSAKSNIPKQGSGRDIYKKYVLGKVIDLRKVAVHYAMSSLFEEYGERETLYCYEVTKKDREDNKAAAAEFAAGCVAVRSAITWEEDEEFFVIIKIGRHDIDCGLCDCRRPETYAAMKARLKESFEKGAFSEGLRIMEEYVDGNVFSIKDLFTDEQRKILSISVDETLKEVERVCLDLYERDRFLMTLLKDFEAPIPKVFLCTAEFALGAELRHAFEQEPFNAARADVFYKELKGLGLGPEQVELEFMLRNRCRDWLRQLAAAPTVENLERVMGLLQFVFKLPFPINLWEAQNIYYVMAGTIYRDLLKKDDGETKKWLAGFRELGRALFFNTEEVLRAGSEQDVTRPA